MRLIALVISFLAALVVINAQSGPHISDVDRIRIAEVFRVGEKLENQLWPGWDKAPFGMLFITDDNEFLIHHPKANSDFVSLGYDKLLKSEVFARPRKFQKNFLATFPAFDAVPVIVIGKAENTDDKTSTRWLFTALHEHFHQLQYSQPTYYSDVNKLGLSRGDNTGMWQINFAFPYKDASIAARFRHLADLLMAARNAITENELRQTLQQYLAARGDFAASLAPDDYKYASFQLWQEGIARYTQFKIAEMAGRKLRPSKSFRALKDFRSFKDEAHRLFAVIDQEMKDLDLTKLERVAFYPFGASEGLLLDKVNPSWRQRYFSDKFALEKYYSYTKN